jgi:hypothetical protein
LDTFGGFSVVFSRPQFLQTKRPVSAFPSLLGKAPTGPMLVFKRVNVEIARAYFRCEPSIAVRQEDELE